MEECYFTKVTLFYGCFSRFLNCTNGIKSRRAPHIKLSFTIIVKAQILLIARLLAVANIVPLLSAINSKNDTLSSYTIVFPSRD